MADDTTQASKPKPGPAGPKEGYRWGAVPPTDEANEADETEGHSWHAGSAVPPGPKEGYKWGGVPPTDEANKADETEGHT